PFENLSGDTALAQAGRIAADWLTQGLAQSDNLEVVSTSSVSLAIGDTKSSTTNVIRRLTNATRATHIVTGSIVKSRDSVRVSASLIDAHTGRVIRVIEPAVAGILDPFAAINLVRERLLGLFAFARYGTPALNAYVPPTFTAYREFMDGLERFVRYWDMRGAQPHFERAIRLDSTFVRAYFYLAQSYE